jgi:hypothetical protein
MCPPIAQKPNKKKIIALADGFFNPSRLCGNIKKAFIPAGDLAHV